MTYSVEHILKIMEEYHIYRRNLNEGIKDYASVGVSIITDMPLPSSLSDNVADEAIKMVEDVPYFNKIRTDMKYLEDRLDRVESEKLQTVMFYRLDGMTIRDIASVTEYSKTHIHRLLNEIAKCIKGDRLG